MGNLKRALAVAAGAISGKMINDFIQRRKINSVSGEEEDLLGLPTNVSKYSTPLITAGVGAATALLSKSQLAKDLSLGVMASGAVGVTQAFFGKDLSSLQGADEPVELMYGNTLPGIGEPSYDTLPTANEAAQQYIPEVAPSNELEDEMAGIDEDMLL